jgi:hypothetical protein
MLHNNISLVICNGPVPFDVLEVQYDFSGTLTILRNIKCNDKEISGHENVSGREVVYVHPTRIYAGYFVNCCLNCCDVIRMGRTDPNTVELPVDELFESSTYPHNPHNQITGPALVNGVPIQAEMKRD